MTSKFIWAFILTSSIGCIHLEKSDTHLKRNLEQSEISYTKMDSVCYHQFNKTINNFLSPDRAAINYSDEQLIPCYMSLIADGDTTAKRVLFERIRTRIEKFKQGENDYISIYKIIPQTLGQISEPASLELCMLLFENSDIHIIGGECFQMGYSVFKNAILNIIEVDKAKEYEALMYENYKDAIAKGLYECSAQAYVVTKLNPIVVSDIAKGNLKLKSLQKP